MRSKYEEGGILCMQIYMCIDSDLNFSERLMH